MLYHNGSFIGSTNTNGSPFNGGLGSLIVGNGTGVLGGNIQSGLLCMTDEARIWARALTGSEILALYQGKTIQPLLGDRRSAPVLRWSGAYDIVSGVAVGGGGGFITFGVQGG